MIKIGIIHGAIISTIVVIAAFLLPQFLPSKEWSTYLLIIILASAWFYSSKTYKRKYGSITLLADKQSVVNLFKFAFGASIIWGPFLSLTNLDITDQNIILYFVTLVLVIPLATVQIVGIMMISNIFINEKAI